MHYKITSLRIFTEVLNRYKSQHSTPALSHVYLVNCIPIDQILALILHFFSLLHSYKKSTNLVFCFQSFYIITLLQTPELYNPIGLSHE